MHIPAGFLVLDKPSGITSRDAVDHALEWFPRSKVGHAGTLDPAATGVLIIGVGHDATRLIEYVQDQEKVYHTVIQLGGVSTTDDAEGNITASQNVLASAEEAVHQALQTMVGVIEQTPPAFSAAKIQGVRAHTKARRGEAVELKPRFVTVHEIEVLRFQFPELEVTIRCSKGTYIRSIARDLGASLGIGGYVKTLRRTRIGSRTCEHAIHWNATGEEAVAALLPLSLAVEPLHRVNLSEEEAWRLQRGQSLACATMPEQEVALWLGEQFLGIARIDTEKQLMRPSKMLQMRRC